MKKFLLSLAVLSMTSLLLTACNGSTVETNTDASGSAVTTDASASAVVPAASAVVPAVSGTTDASATVSGTVEVK